MGLREFLGEHGHEISAAWRESLYGSFPPETARILKKDDRFTNPLGFLIKEMTDSSVAAMKSGADPEALQAAVAPYIRTRAVQEVTPSGAMLYVRIFREIVRKAAGVDAPALEGELEELTDRLMDISFDLYTANREKLHEVRLDEAKRNLFLLLRKAEMVEVREGGS